MPSATITNQANQSRSDKPKPPLGKLPLRLGLIIGALTIVTCAVGYIGFGRRHHEPKTAQHGAVTLADHKPASGPTSKVDPVKVFDATTYAADPAASIRTLVATVSAFSEYHRQGDKDVPELLAAFNRPINYSGSEFSANTPLANTHTSILFLPPVAWLQSPNQNDSIIHQIGNAGSSLHDVFSHYPNYKKYEATASRFNGIKDTQPLEQYQRILVWHRGMDASGGQASDDVAVVNTQRASIPPHNQASSGSTVVNGVLLFAGVAAGVLALFWVARWAALSELSRTKDAILIDATAILNGVIAALPALPPRTAAGDNSEQSETGAVQPTSTFGTSTELVQAGNRERIARDPVAASTGDTRNTHPVRLRRFFRRKESQPGEDLQRALAKSISELVWQLRPQPIDAKAIADNIAIRIKPQIAEPTNEPGPVDASEPIQAKPQIAEPAYEPGPIVAPDPVGCRLVAAAIEELEKLDNGLNLQSLLDVDGEPVAQLRKIINAFEGNMGLRDIDGTQNRLDTNMRAFAPVEERIQWDWFKKCERLRAFAYDVCRRADTISTSYSSDDRDTLLDFKIGDDYENRVQGASKFSVWIICEGAQQMTTPVPINYGEKVARIREVVTQLQIAIKQHLDSLTNWYAAPQRERELEDQAKAQAEASAEQERVAADIIRETQNTHETLQTVAPFLVEFEIKLDNVRSFLETAGQPAEGQRTAFFTQGRIEKPGDTAPLLDAIDERVFTAFNPWRNMSSEARSHPAVTRAVNDILSLQLDLIHLLGTFGLRPIPVSLDMDYKPEDKNYQRTASVISASERRNMKIAQIDRYGYEVTEQGTISNSLQFVRLWPAQVKVHYYRQVPPSLDPRPEGDETGPVDNIPIHDSTRDEDCHTQPVADPVKQSDSVADVRAGELGQATTKVAAEERSIALPDHSADLKNSIVDVMASEMVNATTSSSEASTVSEVKRHAGSMRSVPIEELQKDSGRRGVRYSARAYWQGISREVKYTAWLEGCGDRYCFSTCKYVSNDSTDRLELDLIGCSIPDTIPSDITDLLLVVHGSDDITATATVNLIG